jgi:hypothetical protein
MTTANFYMVHMVRKPAMAAEIVKKKMNLALDWYRIKENLWVVYSTSTPEKLHERLKPLADHLFICELNISNRQGLMPKGFWEWLKKER